VGDDAAIGLFEDIGCYREEYWGGARICVDLESPETIGGSTALALSFLWRIFNSQPEPRFCND